MMMILPTIDIAKKYHIFFFLFLISLTLLHALPVKQDRKPAADVQTQIIGVNKDKHPHYLYLPATRDPNRTYWLVCYAHGAHDFGHDNIVSLKYFVERGDCIGLAPSFDEGFQLLENGTDVQLTQLFDQLKKQYNLHDKLFIFGHSGGGQFAHRFMMRYPDLVIGCAASSSGTWATGGKVYHEINTAAQNIPLAISCGSNDQARIGGIIERLSTQYSETASDGRQNPGWTRNEWFWQFQEQLEEGNFFFKEKEISGAAHRIEETEQEQLALEAFLLGTSGMLPEERAWYDKGIAMIQNNSANHELVNQELEQLNQKVESRSKESLGKTLEAQGWHFSTQALECCMKAAKEFVGEEVIF
ncbi:MAG: hypothetical protein ACOYK6_02970 [Chthoniobacterales bacterium]